MRFEQGDIVQVPFPYSDLSGSKKRPVIIISNQKVNKSMNVICCVISTKPHKDDILIKENDLEGNQLPFTSYFKPHMIFTVNKNLIIKKLAKSKKECFNKLKEKIIENLS